MAEVITVEGGPCEGFSVLSADASLDFSDIERLSYPAPCDRQFHHGWIMDYGPREGAALFRLATEFSADGVIAFEPRSTYFELLKRNECFFTRAGIETHFFENSVGPSGCKVPVCCDSMFLTDVMVASRPSECVNPRKVLDRIGCGMPSILRFDLSQRTVHLIHDLYLPAHSTSMVLASTANVQWQASMVLRLAVALRETHVWWKPGAAGHRIGLHEVFVRTEDIASYMVGYNLL
jgi:hypothetical protein